MEVKLEAGVNILWQNLIALNASLANENEERRYELLHIKELLGKETEKSKALQSENEIQRHELSMKDRQIAQLSSKMVAVRHIVSSDREDANNHISSTTLPIIVKVESYDSDATVPTPVMSLNECDEKFSTTSRYKRNRALHLPPTIPCPKCPLKFARTEYMQKHFVRAHENGLSRMCRMKTASSERT